MTIRVQQAVWMAAFCSLGGLVGHLAAQDKGPVTDRLQRVDYQTSIPVDVTMNYWLYLPPDYDSQPQWPLLVFLHGAGERGDDLEQVKVHGPPKLIAEGQDFPFLVVAPQCGRFSQWQPDAVANLVRDVARKHKVDPSRIYLTGLSMGGYGTWATAAKHPELFAAIVPICGGGDPGWAAALKPIPAWVFHGAQDNVVRLEKSDEMVQAIRAAGGDVQFTVDPDAGHDSWSAAYSNPALYEWLLKQ